MPLHDVREQVAIERRVLVEQVVEGKLTLGGGRSARRTVRGATEAQSREESPWSG